METSMLLDTYLKELRLPMFLACFPHLKNEIEG